MADSDDKEQPIPFLVYDSNTKGKLYLKNNIFINYFSNYII